LHAAAIELMQARLAEPPHRDLTMLRRIGWLLAAISVALVLGAAVHLAWGGEPPREPYSCRVRDKQVHRQAPQNSRSLKGLRS
jgi:hypothetical protein